MDWAVMRKAEINIMLNPYPLIYTPLSFLLYPFPFILYPFQRGIVP